MNAKLTELLLSWNNEGRFKQLPKNVIANLQRRIEAELCCVQHDYHNIVDDVEECVNCGREKE